ncbi:hypothetical protein ACFJIW_14980 [Tahibacter sp. UC22_41]|uniref:hypothetical protein n=1 Tax=Tahibacter sp. UC22_41 TaxID=3350178 RepID=UPI0036DEFB2B
MLDPLQTSFARIGRYLPDHVVGQRFVRAQTLRDLALHVTECRFRRSDDEFCRRFAHDPFGIAAVALPAAYPLQRIGDRRITAPLGGEFAQQDFRICTLLPGLPQRSRFRLGRGDAPLLDGIADEGGFRRQALGDAVEHRSVEQGRKCFATLAQRGGRGAVGILRSRGPDGVVQPRERGQAFDETFFARDDAHDFGTAHATSRTGLPRTRSIAWRRRSRSVSGE